LYCTRFSGGHEVGFYRDIAPDGQTLEFGVQGEARVWRLLGKPEGISYIETPVLSLNESIEVS
jgi:hypothetical protein